jgi:hypothetical protein
MGNALVAEGIATAQDPDGLAPAHLRKAVIRLPEGVSLSPGAADGLKACTDAELKPASSEPAACPNASNVGAVEIETPVLEHPLEGHVFVRPSTSTELFRLVVVASGPGVVVKLPGVVRPDPFTGQVTAIFDELPQLPFSRLHVHFRGGPRAVLANPLRCGAYRAEGVLTPWSGTDPVTDENLIEFGAARCNADWPFAPDVSAGTVNPVAGVSSPLIVRVQRAEGDQQLGRVSVTLPPGLTASVREVELCTDGDAHAGHCPAASRIGTATVGAGPGPAPLYLRGDIYLTEAYRGGRFGLAIVVPAVAGPFDLGTVVVRAAVMVDQRTAQLSVESDELPRILSGVQLRLRDIHLAIDRDRFVHNPTSCRAMLIAARVDAIEGATATRLPRFQVGDCAALPFRPRMAVALTGSGRTEEGDRPGFRLRVRPRRGDANLRRVAFTLPPEIAFDATRGGPRLCTRAQLADHSCPKGSRIGKARAMSPLLKRPLAGPVYFIRGVRGDPFPKLAMRLDGELPIDLLGDTAVTRRGLRTTFKQLPDVPLREFSLRLAPGLLTPDRDLCAERPHATVEMDGQNGKRRDLRLGVAVPCKPSPRVRLRSLRATSDRILVRGTIRRRVTGAVFVTVRCGSPTSRASGRPKAGRFSVRLRLPGRCRGRNFVRLEVRYRGDRAFSSQRVARKVRLRRPAG